MVKKILAGLVLAVLWCSCALAEVTLYHAHRSIAGLTDGHSDYSNARFLNFYVSASDWEGIATQADVNLTGTMTFSGGSYSFWDGKHGMRTISGTPHTFGLSGVSWMHAGDALEYVPMTASGDNVIFCLAADGGLNGVNVSWNLPPYSGQGTIPNYKTTQQQLASCVPYIEFIRSGSQVTGVRWRAVNPSDTSTPAPQNYDISFSFNRICDKYGNTIYDGNDSWPYIPANTTPEGTVTFETQIDESEIHTVWVYLNNNSDAPNWGTYLWYFSKPSTPQTWLYENHTFNASLVNGKSDYSNARFVEMFFDVQADEGVIAEAHHFTAEASLTIPGGGYTLGDNGETRDENIPGEELETIPAGTDKTFKLVMTRGTAPGDTYLEYQPVDENGVILDFRKDSKTNLPGKVLTWTFPTEPSLSGSATVSSFKSAEQQLAEGVPYIELVSADGKLTAVNFRMVTSSDTSRALTLPYRTNVRIRLGRISSDVTGWYYWSNWMYNTSSGTWTLDKPQDLSNIDAITVRYRSWENPEKSLLYQWQFYPASSAAPDPTPPAPSSLTITTASLPAATVSTAYTAALSANTSGATWSVSSGTLPAGLTLNSSTGAISGTPTTAGTSTFTVRAVSGTQSAEKQFSITINASSPGGSSGGGCESFTGISGLILLAVLFRKHRYSA